MYDYEDHEKTENDNKDKKTEWVYLLKILYSDFKFQHPMSILVVGPINSGKTYFVDQLLSNLNEWIHEHLQQRNW